LIERAGISTFDSPVRPEYSKIMYQDELIADATKIIVEKANPKRIILFGSRARGEAHQDSDLDLLIILPDGASSSEAKKTIGRALMSPFASFDLIVYTESEYEKKRREGWSIFDEIDRDGSVIYAA
jgi:predicted nucleotidyltransferase